MKRNSTDSSPILATDLDGTLIPLPNHPANVDALQELASGLRGKEVALAYVTGRHIDSVEEAIREFDLPEPDWIVADVGTEIWRVTESHEGRRRTKLEAYGVHMEAILGSYSCEELRGELDSIAGLTPQSVKHQKRFKLSYYADYYSMSTIVPTVKSYVARAEAPYSVVDSCNHVTGEAYVDLLPRDVSKAYALRWWLEEEGFDVNRLVFAGDSGNDLAAFVAGYRSIVVANADRGVVKQAVDAHSEAGWKDRLYLSNAAGTSGLLEGCRWFGLL